MNLLLDTTEAGDLKEALQAHVQRLLYELTRADDRKYRQMLREKLRRFEQLTAKVGNGSAEAAPPAH